MNQTTKDAMRVAKPALLNKIPTQGPVVLEASAGTGKTYTIERLVVDLLLTRVVRDHDGQRPGLRSRLRSVRLDEILVLTFTDAAASELRQRIRQMLEEVAFHPTVVSEGSESAYWSVTKEDQQRLEKELWNFDRAPIGTIHWFCRRVLSEYAFAVGRSFRQDLVHDKDLIHPAFLEVIRKELAPDPMNAGASAIHQLFGAGIESGVASRETVEKWLLGTLDGATQFAHPFSWDRYAEHCAALASLVADRSLDEVLGEIREDYRRLKIHAATIKKHLGILGEWIRLAADPRARGLLLICVDKERGYLDEKGTLARDFVDNEVSASLRAVVDFYQAAVPFQSAISQLLLPKVREWVTRHKRREGLVSYDDMIGDVVDLVSNSKHGLRDELARRYQFALVDEFQDTDTRQWEIFRQIFGFAQGEPAGQSAGHSAGQSAGQSDRQLFVIGDPKQSIYRFRGADLETYLNATQAMVAFNEPLVLKDCFRATKPLIDAYNAVVGSEKDASLFPADGKVHYSHPVDCGRPDLRFERTEGTPVPPLVIGKLKPNPTEKEGKYAADELRRIYARWIADELVTLLGDGESTPEFGGATKEKLKPSDVYVLTYSNREATQMGRALREVNIPFAFYKLDGLFQTDEARHVLDLLRWLESPSDRSRLKRVLLTPFFASSLIDVAALGNESVPALDELYDRWMPWIVGRRYDRLFSSLVAETGIIVRELLRTDSERELTNYLHLFDILREEGLADSLSLSELARRLEMRLESRFEGEGETDIQRLESDREAVKIMTIHKSKGLEATVVAVFGGFSTTGKSGDWATYHRDSQQFREPGSFCSEHAQVEEEEKAELARLAYVAITRAKGRVYLPYFSRQQTHREIGRYSPFCERLEKMEERGELVEPMAVVEVGPQDSRSREIPFRHRVGEGSEEPAEERESDRPVSPLSTEETSESAAPPVAAETPAEAREEEQQAAGSLRERIRQACLATGWMAPSDAEPHDETPMSPLAVQAAHAEDNEVTTNSVRHAHAARVVTSYTRLHKQHLALEGERESENRAFYRDDETAPAPPTLAGDLPAGAATGIFLHAVLERLPRGELAPLTELSQWQRCDAFMRLFAPPVLQRHGLEEKHAEGMQRIVHAAMTQRYAAVEGEGLLPPLVAVERMRHEMEFLLPYPDQALPRLDAPWAAGLTIERGFLKGVVDLLFEVNGRIYILDWKSNLLADYSPRTLGQVVKTEYELQLEIYTLAIARMIGVASQAELAADFESRFGGVFYVFLRGLRGVDGSSSGIVFARPSWEEVLSFEEKLRRSDPRFPKLASGNRSKP